MSDNTVKVARGPLKGRVVPWDDIGLWIAALPEGKHYAVTLDPVTGRYTLTYHQ